MAREKREHPRTDPNLSTGTLIRHEDRNVLQTCRCENLLVTNIMRVYGLANLAQLANEFR